MHFYCRELVIGSGEQKTCEDRVLILPSLAVIIDGATEVLGPSLLNSLSEGTWISDFILQRLMQIRTTGVNPSTILLSLSRDIDQELENLHWPKDKVPPVCSIAILLLSDSGLEVATLGDVSVLYRVHGKTRRIFNQKFQQNEKAAFAGIGSGGNNVQDSDLLGILSRRKGYILGRNGAGVLSRSEMAISAAVREKLSPKPGDTLLLATDGFMRLTDFYGIVSSEDELFIRANQPGGITELFTELRRHESSGAIHKGTLKKADDAAAALVEVIA